MLMHRQSGLLPAQRRTQLPSCAQRTRSIHIVTRAAQATVNDAHQHLAYLREQLVAHNLEAITPYMSELAVVKAVVRQHQARLAWQKQEADRAQQQSYYTGDAEAPYDAPYDGYGYYGNPASQAYMEEYNNFNYMPSCAVPGVPATPSKPAGAADGRPSHQNYAWASAPSSTTDRTPSASYSRTYSTSQIPPPVPSLHSGSSSQSSSSSCRPPDFMAILESSTCSQDQHGQLMDSFAMRHLILSRPAQLEPLSSMMVDDDQCVQRCLSTSLYGEKCVLTLTVKRRNEQELKSTYSKQPIKQAWVLARVCGEPVSAAPLEAINPEHPPEAIVAAQLQAFRDCDFDVAYALTSPVGRAVAGTRERFRSSLQSDFRYQQLLMHESAVSLQRAHNGPNTYLEVFSIKGMAGAPCLYIWVAVRQLEGLYKNCWLVEYVTPVRDPEIVKVLKLGY